EVEGETLQYPVYETDESFCYDFDGMKKMIDEVKPRILLVASPNNPTGNGLTPDELGQLIEMVPQETVVLVDEAYASYVTSDITYITNLIARYPNLVICRTLSKFYGLPGLRMGFGFVGNSDEMAKFAKYSNKYLGYDRLSEEVAIAALNSEDHYREIANVMDEARRMYKDELGSLPGFKVYKSVANFILIKYPIEKKEELQKAFAGEEYKVKFMNEPDLNEQMRITLGRKEQNRKVCDIILSICKQ
ncbi:MAG: aminotransferase class I/II-fold pyridoxal phosphate-dependent enzyme, partial [Prevotellaceae bacterium]|nr:aminotransferase class I/II-fold pyridoxal phosphate-dependent enzyme [Prevotellaceae bacterium]